MTLDDRLIPSSSRQKTGGEMDPHPAAAFDVGRALEALDLAIEAASQTARPGGYFDANSPIVISIVDVLKDIQRWIEQQKTPYRDFGGASLIHAAASSHAIELPFFIAAVRAAFLDLSRVHTFVSLGHDLSRKTTEGVRAAGESK